MHGISTINIELTSRCNKSCHMCGRRQLEKENPDYKKTLGDIDFDVFVRVLPFIQKGMVVQLHWNGEPTLYPRIYDASLLLSRRGAIVCMDTNGLTLRDRGESLLLFDSITVSVIQGDSTENYERQIKQLSEFMKLLKIWPDKKPKVNIRALGKIPVYFEAFSDAHGVEIIRRIFHSPRMSRDYQKTVTKPEIGVCLDLLHHPAIDRHGNVFPCVRFNPKSLNLLGNITEEPPEVILLGDYRSWMIEAHFAGRRQEVPLCRECHYWGAPRGE